METYKRLFKYVPDKQHLIWIVLLFSCVAGACYIMGYWQLWLFLKALFTNDALQDVGQVAMSVMLYLIGYWFFYFIAVIISHIVAFRLETNLRKKGIQQLMQASLAFFSNHSSGKIRKTIDDNATDTHTAMAHLVPDTLMAIVRPLAMIVILFMIDWRLVVFLIIAFIIAFMFLGKMAGDKDAVKAYNQALDDLSSETVEYVRGMQVVKIFGLEVRFYKNLYQSIKDYAKFCLDFTFSFRHSYVMFQTWLNIFILLPIPFVLWNSSQTGFDSILFAKIIFFAVFSSGALGALMQVSGISNELLKAKTALDKLEDLFGEMMHQKPDFGKRSLVEEASIDFQDVSFSYHSDDDQAAYILKDFNLSLEAGRTYAMVGESGSGKSTIAKLLAGFYATTEGTIYIGGHPIEAYEEKALFQEISFVFQNTELFPVSIYENVRIGNSSASREQIMQALELAQCFPIINKLPNGVDTIVGTKGVYLSGGEKQRIAVARAMLKDAKILILDEATAASDPENEYKMQIALKELMANKTVVMIAHRLTALRNVDEILVLDDGQIIERGSHQTLIDQNGYYANLQRMYQITNEWKVRTVG